jgi:hypothetical protein
MIAARRSRLPAIGQRPFVGDVEAREKKSEGPRTHLKKDRSET